MTFVAEYRRQFVWRAWPTVFAALPSFEGQLVLDLGCGVGDLAAELAARGARVLACDLNEELIDEGRKLHPTKQIDFRVCDLRAVPDVGPFDGLWCSFGAAYFPGLDEWLRRWTTNLKPGGWLALTEVDDLFGHEPLTPGTAALLDAYAQEALQAKRYDFQMGRKVQGVVERAGFRVQRLLELDDRELSFAGAAEPAVLEAWRKRLERMTLLQRFCGASFAALRDEFLACLASPLHRSRSRVICCIATRAPEPNEASAAVDS